MEKKKNGKDGRQENRKAWISTKLSKSHKQTQINWANTTRDRDHEDWFKTAAFSRSRTRRRIFLLELSPKTPPLHCSDASTAAERLQTEHVAISNQLTKCIKTARKPESKDTYVSRRMQTDITQLSRQRRQLINWPQHSSADWWRT